MPTITVPTEGADPSISSGLEVLVDTIPTPFVTLNVINTSIPDERGLDKECSTDSVLGSTVLQETISQDPVVLPAHHSTIEIPLSKSVGFLHENFSWRLFFCFKLHERLHE